MNKTSRSGTGVVLTVSTLLAALILSLINGYFYMFRIDVTDVDGIYQSILLKNDGSELILGALFVVVLVGLTVAGLLLMKKDPPAKEGTEDGLPLLFARCLVGAAAVAALIMGFVLSREGTPYVIEYIGTIREVPSFLVALYEKGVPIPAETQHYIALLLPLLTVPAALYFLLPALFSVKNKTVLFFTGLSTLLLLAGELLLTHYFMMDFLSSPTRVFAVFGYSTLTIFLLLDLKKLAHTANGNRLRVIFALLAFVINTADALPRLVLSFMARDPFSVTLTTFHTLLRLMLGVYALVSVLPLFTKKAEEEEEETPCVPEEGTLQATEEKAVPENEQASEQQEPPVFDGAENENITPLSETQDDGQINENKQGDTESNG